MKIHTVKIPLYFEKLKIVVTDNFDTSVKELKMNHLPNMNDYASFVVPTKSFLCIFISSNATIGIIAHETVHIVNYVFKRANISLDLDNDEPQAYLSGWIAETIHKFLK